MPEKIGNYTIASQLGRGGMGVVYKAYDESLRRFVAIKVLTDNLTDDETFLHRFVREAQAAASITHPNIVQIYFIGEHEGKPYFVMEYVTGKSLAQLLREEKRIANPRAAQMILQAAQGLAAAHDHGIIHRDIKPGNLMLDERGIVKVADFGLALPVAADKRLTATGMLVGTPGYLAPEQCRGEAVDHRTDIYALGVTYYELLSGNSPFRAESPFALMRQILEEQPPDLAALFPDVDEETRRIVSKMLCKDREQRYQNCHELAADLEELLAKSGVRSATAGLATRTPTAAGRTPATANAATEFIGVPGAASNAPTAILNERTEVLAGTPVAAATDPAVPFAEPATLIDPRAQAPVAVPPPVQRRSSAALVMVVLAVIAGAGLLAAYAGLTFYRGWQARQQPAMAVSQPAPPPPSATASEANAALLLSQPATTTAQLTGTPGSTPPPDATTAGTQGNTAPSRTPPVPASTAGTMASAPLVNPAANTPRTVARPSSVEPQQQRPAAPARSLSGVAVVVTGDAALTGPVATVLTEELGAAGLTNVVDAANDPSLEDVSRGDPSTSRLLARLREEGIATLVVARLQPSGQRELNYMGRQDTAYNARLTLTSYDVASGKAIGAAASAQMEYTGRTAEREAERVVAPLARARAAIIQSR